MVGLAPGVFTFYVGTDPAKVELVREAFVGEIGKLAAEGLTEQELARAKKKLLGKQAISYQSNASLAYTARSTNSTASATSITRRWRLSWRRSRSTRSARSPAGISTNNRR